MADGEKGDREKRTEKGGVEGRDNWRRHAGKGKKLSSSKGEIDYSGGISGAFSDVFGFLEDFHEFCFRSDFLEGGRIPITFFI